MGEKREWYLPNLDGDAALGPYTQEDLLKKLKSGELRHDQFTWTPGFTDMKWKRFYELDEFKEREEKYPVLQNVPKKKSQGIKKQKKVFQVQHVGMGEYGLRNEYRRYPRVPIVTDVIIHNGQTYCHGTSIDISEKGLFLKPDDMTIFEKGEEITVTVRNAPVIGTFSTPSVVISISKKEKGYGIYFIRINPQIKRKIAKYVLTVLQKSFKNMPEENVA